MVLYVHSQQHNVLLSQKKKNMECININKNGAVISFKDTSEYLY